jgi:hypothetical protein
VGAGGNFDSSNITPQPEMDYLHFCSNEIFARLYKLFKANEVYALKNQT